MQKKCLIIALFSFTVANLDTVTTLDTPTFHFHLQFL